jgi:hypothetical protein
MHVRAECTHVCSTQPCSFDLKPAGRGVHAKVCQKRNSQPKTGMVWQAIFTQNNSRAQAWLQAQACKLHTAVCSLSRLLHNPTLPLPNSSPCGI